MIEMIEMGSVYESVFQDIADYPSNDLSNLISNDLASSVQMNRTLFIQAVDRMCQYGHRIMEL